MKIRFYILLILICSCATKSEIDLSDIQNQLNQKFNKGKELFDKGKYTRAKDEFDYILLNDRGSDIGVQARFYQAETLYMLEQFDEAISSYQKVLQFSDDSDKIELSKFKICKCYFDLSNQHNRDQSNNDLAIEKLQYFIEKESMREYVDEIEQMILDLRTKLAKKNFHTAKLYVRLEELDSAVIYYDSIIKEYYDTAFVNHSLINIATIYFIDNKEKSISYLGNHKNSFISINDYESAVLFINNLELNQEIEYYIDQLK